MAPIKSLITKITAPLTHMCNLSLMNGVYPHKMKIAKVVPIIKTGKIYECCNYRPISVKNLQLNTSCNCRFNRLHHRFRLINCSLYLLTPSFVSIIDK